MEAEDWLKGVEKKLVITRYTDHEKVLFAAHQLYGMTANWWETYCNTHASIDTITWNKFKAHFHTHYVPHNTMKLKKNALTIASKSLSWSQSFWISYWAVYRRVLISTNTYW
jgi:hypothetical protein